MEHYLRTFTFNFVTTSLLDNFLKTRRKSASTRLSISSAPWTAGTYPGSFEAEIPNPTNPDTAPFSRAKSSAALPLLDGWKKNVGGMAKDVHCTHSVTDAFNNIYDVYGVSDGQE